MCNTLRSSATTHTACKGRDGRGQKKKKTKQKQLWPGSWTDRKLSSATIARRVRMLRKLDFGGTGSKGFQASYSAQGNSSTRLKKSETSGTLKITLAMTNSVSSSSD